MIRAYEAIKAVTRFFVRHWPFGDLWSDTDGKGGTIRVTKSLMVVMSDGRSTDALPLNFCSQEFVDRVGADIARRWYMPTASQAATDAEKGQQNG
jgi:hypothetical protein